MSVEVTVNASTKELVVKISGRFDFSLHQDFRKISEGTAQNVKSITIDLARTDYIDSSALGMLLILRDKVGDNKGLIKVINATADVKKILQIANFDKLFTLV